MSQSRGLERCTGRHERRDASWNAEQQAVEFGVEIGEYSGVVRVPRRVFQRLLSDRPTVRRGVLPPANPVREHRRAKAATGQLTEDGNVEISGRDLR
jgi:hypothetical protein